MLDELESATFARDTVHLASALAGVFGPGLEIERCDLVTIGRISDISGSTPGGVLASYRVALHDVDRQTRAVQFYSGHVRPDAGDFYQAVDHARLAPVAYGPSALYVDGLQLVLFAFPNDPLLPHLASCLTAGAVEECLGSIAEFRDARVVEFTALPLKYDPGRGCTCRVTVTMVRADARHSETFIAKTHRTDRMSRTFESMTRVWADPACHSESWSIPRPLFFDRARRLLWQASLGGRSFWSVYPNLDVIAVFRQMARVAASLHAISFAPHGRLLTDVPTSQPDFLVRASPDLSRRHEQLLQRLWTSRESLEPAAVVSLHGDFHPEQFLVDGDWMGLTDFDSARWGDPAHDVGRFTSHVLLKALQQDIEPERFGDALEAFLEEYVRHAWSRGIRARACWQVAAQLLGRRVHKLFKHVTEPPPETIERLLGFAEVYLDRSID